MREFVLELLAVSTRLYSAQPLWATAVGAIGMLAILAAAGASLRAYLAAGASISAGPLLLLSALATLGLCLLWTVTDGVLLALDEPLLSERLIVWLAPDQLTDSQLLRAALALPEGAEGIRLPAAVTMTIGLAGAGLLYIGAAAIVASFLTERISLELKPADILHQERRAKERKQPQEAGAEPERAPEARAGDAAKDPDSESPKSPARPLPDDLFGRSYKLAGHFHDWVTVEPRFIRWQRPLAALMLTLTAIGIAPCAAGVVPVPMWVATAILASALRGLVSVDQKSAEESEAEAEANDAAETEKSASQSEAGASEAGASDQDQPTTAGPPPAFIERAEIASRLDVAPSPTYHLWAGIGAQAPAPDRRHPPVGGQKLLTDITRALGVDALHSHQRAAVCAFDAGHSVLLSTPPGSGRKLFGDALMLYALLSDAERVLYVSANRRDATLAQARFQARAEATHWKWNILAVNLAGRPGAADPSKAQPALIFAHPDAVHRELCGHSGNWQAFLSGLGAIIVPDLHRYSGVPAAHLSHLFRRLVRAVDRASGQAAKPSGVSGSAGTGRIRFVATADPGYQNLGRYVERITGRAVIVMGPERDGTPRHPIDARIVRPDAGPDTGPDAGPDPIHPAISLAEAARQTEYSAALHGYDGVLTAAEQGVLVLGSDANDPPDVVVARLSPASYFALPLMTRHLGGAPAADRPERAVLWQPDRSPLAEFLARERPLAGHGRALIAWPGSPLVERGHLLCTLAEGEVTLDELIAIFSRPVLTRTLSDLRRRGRLLERRRRLLDAGAGAVTTERTVAITDREGIHAATNLFTTGVPARLCERATGEVIRYLEGERARAAAYPHRILLARGRRFAVLADADQDQLGHGRLLAEERDAPMQSVPIRTLLVEVIERRKAGHEPNPAGERRRGAVRTIGGAPFTLQRRNVAVTESVAGVRRFDLTGTELDTTLYDEPIICQFETRATLMGFEPMSAAGEEVSLDVLHAVVHGFRAALDALVALGEDDVDVAPLARTEIWSVPSIAFVDLHPGAGGFVDAIDLEVIRHLVSFTQALFTRCPIGCTAGCPSCVHVTTCRAPASHYQRVDKAGAVKLLTALRPLRQAGQT